MMTTEAKYTCKKCGKTRPFSDGSDLQCYRCVERRERIATAVLAGLCANPTPSGKVKELIQEALDISDVLIRALDYERKTGANSVQNGGDNGEA